MMTERIGLKARLSLLFLDLYPFVAHRHSAIEDEFIGRRIVVDAIVSHALELAAIAIGHVAHCRLDVSIENVHRMRINTCLEIAIFCRHRVFERKELVNHAKFGGQCMLRTQPVNRHFDFATIGRFAAKTLGIIRTTHLDNVPVFVFVDAVHLTK